jgi:Ca2+-transporting ATPase
MAPLLGQSVNEARTLSFITLIVSNLCLILANRSWSMSVFSSMKQKNTALIVVITGAIVFLGLFVFVPVLRDMFYFGIMHPIDIAIATVAGIVSVLWFEALKFFINKKRKIRN